MRKILFTLLFLSFPVLSQAATFNVTNGATLQTALTTAETNGQDNIINLAAGTYTSASPFIFNSIQTTSLTLQGAGATTTMLDGLATTGILSVINRGDIHLRGVTVQNGHNATAGAGAVLIVSGGAGNITVNQSAFIGNNSGGGFAGLVISNGGTGSATIDGSTFSNNHSTGATSIVGGIGIFGAGDVTFTHNTIAGNTSAGNDPTKFGSAGFYIQGAQVTFNNNFVLNNHAIFNVGGGHIQASNGLIFTQNIVEQNKSDADLGGVLANVMAGNVNFTNNLIDNNEATGRGGGFYIASSGTTGSFTFNANQILKNTAASADPTGGFGGGVVSVRNPQNFITNNLAAGNKATASSYGGLGIMITQDNAVLNVVNNTITGNTAVTTVGGVGVHTNFPADTANIYNNIIYGNTASSKKDIFIHQFAGSTLRVFNNDFVELCFDGGACDLSILGADQGANVSADPLFINAATGNYGLSPTSPAKDTALATAPGIPSSDINNNPRVAATAPDMGAFEEVPTSSSGPGAGGGGCSLASGSPSFTWVIFLGLPFLKMKRKFS